ncbi:MAG: glucose 1-dehydrogenase [Chloroflexi bacterium]|nr:glucose 1-dehydrogenase [Chloroflexota bacterium]
MSLAGKCALVTGAGVGIGREVALEMARQGANVALSYHSSSRGAYSAVDKIRALGRRGEALHADLRHVEECCALVDGAVEYLGCLDILVNNAGVTRFQSFLDVREQDFDDLFQLNIRGQFFCAQQAARAMRAKGSGVIINILSVHAMTGYPDCSVYAATKGAIMAWTRELAIELAPHHIRVVGVAPGAIEVPRYQEFEGYSREAFGRLIPWGRIGLPQDIAKTVAFLASDDADYIVGEIVTVDGGTTARMALDLNDL